MNPYCEPDWKSGVGNLGKSLISFGAQFPHLLTDEGELHPEFSNFVICVRGCGGGVSLRISRSSFF